MYCDLDGLEVKSNLMECSRFEQVFKVPVKAFTSNMERETIIEPAPQVVDLGCGAVPKKKGWPLGKPRNK